MCRLRVDVLSPGRDKMLSQVALVCSSLLVRTPMLTARAATLPAARHEGTDGIVSRQQGLQQQLQYIIDRVPPAAAAVPGRTPMLGYPDSGPIRDTRPFSLPGYRSVTLDNPTCATAARPISKGQERAVPFPGSHLDAIGRRASVPVSAGRAPVPDGAHRHTHRHARPTLIHRHTHQHSRPPPLLPDRRRAARASRSP